MMANGLLAGLVAITAPSAFVNSIGSVIVWLRCRSTRVLWLLILLTEN